MAFTYDPLSPIRWISSVKNPTEAQKIFVKSPSTYEYELEDVSKPDAGRTEDAMMHKKRMGQVCKLNMAWQNVDTTTVSTLLKAFQPEYIYANYIDALTGTYRTDKFYVGNRSAPMYSRTNNIWTNVAFNIIRQDGGTMIS